MKLKFLTIIFPNVSFHTLHFYQLIIDLRNLISIIQGKFDLDNN